MTSEFDALSDRTCFRIPRDLYQPKSLVSRFAVATAVAVGFANACHDPSSIAVIEFWILLFIGAALSATAAQQAQPGD